MTSYTFKIVVEPDEDRWRAFCPELEHLGAATWGHTRQEALRHIGDVLEMIAAEAEEEGRRLPEAVLTAEEPLVSAIS